LRIRAAVGSWVDLEAEFVGPVESLIDHVTEEIITESD
jgi:hypothetical protein